MLIYKSQILPEFNLIVVEKTDKYWNKFEKLFEDFGVAFVDADKKTIFMSGKYIFENTWFEKKHLDFIEAHEAAHVILNHGSSTSRNIKEEREADYLAIIMLEKMNNIKAAKLGKDEFLVRNGVLFESTETLLCDKTKKIINEFLIPDENRELIMEQIMISESRIADMKEKYNNVPEMVFNNFIVKDPSGNQKYLNWMLSAYTHLWVRPKTEEHMIEASDNIIQAVSDFHYNINKIDADFIKSFMLKLNMNPEFGDNRKIIRNPKDLYSYPTNQLSKFILLVDKLSQKPTKNDIRNIIKNETDKILNTPEWLIVVPKTHKASCLYGKNTRWCTTMTDDPETFNDYIKKGTIFYVINNKTNNKTAILVRELGDIEIYDEKDKPIDNELPDIVWKSISDYCNNIMGYEINSFDNTQITTANSFDDIDVDDIINFDNDEF